jgi:hypothetical protein
VKRYRPEGCKGFAAENNVRCETCYKLIRILQYRQRNGDVFLVDDLNAQHVLLKKQRKAVFKELDILKEKCSSLKEDYDKIKKEMHYIYDEEILKVMIESFKQDLLPEDECLRYLLLDHLKMAKLKLEGKQRSMKWSPKMIKFALQFVHVGKSRAYNALGTQLNLPSLRRLYDYSHIITQNTGWIKEDIVKMIETIRILQKSVYGYMCFDKVKIQEGLVWNNKDELIGFAEDHQSSNTLVTAKYVLQFIFKTLDTNVPLSFPLAHFYTAALNSKDITDRFYEGVK